MNDAVYLPLKISERREAFRCPFMTITHQRAEFKGFAKDYFVVNFRRRGGVVAIRDDAVLLVQQYRFLVNNLSWELPGGTINDGEDLQAGLSRECLEETGVLPRELRPLVEYYPGLDNVDNRTSIFLSCKTETIRRFRSDPTEVRAIEWIPLRRCVNMVFEGQILDAMTVIGILAYAQDHAKL